MIISLVKDFMNKYFSFIYLPKEERFPNQTQANISNSSVHGAVIASTRLLLAALFADASDEADAIAALAEMEAAADGDKYVSLVG
jgi:hypothetical protein